MRKTKLNRWTGWASNRYSAQLRQLEDLAHLQQENRQLVNSQRVLNAILENIPESIAVVDAADDLHPVLSKYAEEQIRQKQGKTGDAQLDLSLQTWKLFYSDGITVLPAADFPSNRVMREGIPLRDQEVVVRIGDGPQIPLLCSASPIRDAAGRITGAVAIYVDISERKQVELEREQLLSKIRAERDRLLAVINSIKDEVWLCDAQGHIDLVNYSAVQALGYECVEDLFHPVAQIVNELDIFNPDGTPRPPEKSPLLVTLQGVSVRGEEIVRNKKTGEKLYREFNTAPIRSETGEVTGAVAVTRDISLYKQTMQALRESEQRFQRVASAIEEGVWDIVLAHHDAWWNAAYDRLYGPRPSGTHLSPDWWEERLHAEDRQRVLNSSNAALEGDSQRWRAEYRFRRADNTYAYVLDRAWIERDENGRAVRITGAMLDLTELKQALAALQESKDRLQLTSEAVQQGTWDWDLVRDHLVWDERCKALFGLPPETEMSYQKFLDAIHPEDRQRTDDSTRNTLEKGQIYDMEYRVTWPDQSAHWIYAKGRALYDGEGKPIRMIGIALDIDSRKQHEENNRAYAARIEVQRSLIEQREQERLEIARDLHDGPMQELIILSYTCQEIADSMEDPAHREALIQVRANLQEQVRELRTYAAELRPPTLADFGLEKAIRAHVSDFQEKHPDLQVDFQAEKQPVNQIPETSRMAMYRIYQELLKNVVKHSRADQVLIRLNKNDLHVCLEVQDNGKGFTPPKEWVELVRQKHLGLVGIQERAEAVGGSVEIRSTPGQGTLVRVTIPV